ncbi:DUF4351 domain-containing protein [Alkalinema pantanalense CENA528]|uniref:DUF4351 domain-containing protein n=1 Tax=Alkalinema pantanalense TaxID=1620705 RepID=UPI003D6E8CEE
MPYVTSVEQIGYERGIQEGRQQGQELLILQLLARKFGSLPQPIHERIHQLSIEQLNALALAIFDLTSIEDLTTWLDASNVT